MGGALHPFPTLLLEPAELLVARVQGRTGQAIVLSDPRLRTCPHALDLRGMEQCLHYHAILFGFLPESGQLLLRCLRGADIEINPYAFKSNRHRFGHSQCPLQIQITLNRHLDIIGRYPHSGGYHLASDLRTSRQSPEEQIPGTGASASPSNALVCLSVMDRTPEVHRTRDWRVGLSAMRGQSDPGTGRSLPIGVFQRPL